MKIRPNCVQLRTFLKGNLGPRCLGALTGQDAKALDAAIHIIELYSYADGICEQRLMEAFGRVVTCMQPSTMYLAYHAIAYAMNWEDRPRIWAMAGLSAIPVPRCSHEPAERTLQPTE